MSSFDSLNKLRYFLELLSNPLLIIAVNKTFWGDYTCPPGCGGCCHSFSMDLFEDEFEQFKVNYPEQVEYFKPVQASFFNQEVTIYSNRDLAEIRFKKNTPLERKCMFLSGIGRCAIHKNTPLLCQFELNKFSFDQKRNRVILRKKLFGRGWNLTRIDNQRGALCEILPITPETIEIVKRRDIALLKRLTWLLEQFKVEVNRGHELLDLLDYQYEILKSGGTIKPITIIGENRLQIW